MQIKTTAFNTESGIPEKYTCQGANISPEIFWDNVPDKTMSFVFIMEDSDAAAKPWTHWLVYNIPAESRTLPAHFPSLASSADGTLQGRNNFLKIGYDGPCPPRERGARHYIFRIYAMDSVLPLKAGVDREELQTAMDGHVLGQAELTGIFAR
jgi:hypothetical protein